ncbi:MAG: hypothetical protein KGP35_02880 [Bacteroidetes bacterium]|nr:hypothetical protein [Bacteroidota bacterium]
MNNPENLQEVIEENIPLIKDYVASQTNLIQLKSARALSTTLGILVWFIISIFLIFLVLTFSGMMLGFWLSEKVGSLAAGFGITTLLFLSFIGFITLLRKQLFINPLISLFIHALTKSEESDSQLAAYSSQNADYAEN